ncbi:probable ubiquitin-like-specific protease 2A [Xenia sp. Carnegie-2017]|uniref:probable ubiquitin-like-specific protease 2A n=1 Tax=Xenia sp. Carnegie-2017 TaxID=2897299 RepID=UPI001F042173|nr:probable ubiquitin-like-specific protease 2A [Xenia sp. Carnegie-2017]
MLLMIGSTKIKYFHKQNPVNKDENEAAFLCKTDDTVSILETENSDPPMKSVVLFGFDVQQEDIDSLQPKGLITDTILSILMSEHCCEYPIVDTLFYSVLVGDQELKVRTSSRLERIQAAEQFFSAKLLEKDYVFVPINRSLHWFLAIISPW